MELITHICNRCAAEFNGGKAYVPPPKWRLIAGKLICGDCIAAADFSGHTSVSAHAPTPVSGALGQSEYELPLRCGVMLDLADPDYSRVHIRDIASGLARECRFNGQIAGWWPVAAHCVVGSMIAPKEIAYDFLMHDAAEAVIKDITSPLKRLLGEAYARIETMHEQRCFKRFRVPMTDKASVKRIDMIMLAAEFHVIGGQPAKLAFQTLQPHEMNAAQCASVHIRNLHRPNANWERPFLERFAKLAPIELITEERIAA